MRGCCRVDQKKMLIDVYSNTKTWLKEPGRWSHLEELFTVHNGETALTHIQMKMCVSAAADCLSNDRYDDQRLFTTTGICRREKLSKPSCGHGSHRLCQGFESSAKNKQLSRDSWPQNNYIRFFTCYFEVFRFMMYAHFFCP